MIHNLKTSHLFWNKDKCDRVDVPFNIIIGGRGTGKTYLCLGDAYEMSVDSNDKFMYLRRTEVEVSSVVDEKYNPFKALNRDYGWNVVSSFTAKTSMGEFHIIDEEEEIDKFIGYAAAVSTFGNLRGADLSDVSLVIYDEFIRGKNKRALRDEFSLFTNTCETISRNREVLGYPPLKVFMLSNSTSLDSPILVELGLVTVIEKMKQDNRSAYTDKKRGLHLELLQDIPISKMKEETALYRLTKGTSFFEHSINNEFVYDSFENIQKVDLSNYLPFIKVSDVYIYRHKDTSKMHACRSRNDHSLYKYSGDAIPLFRRHWGIKMLQIMRNGTLTYSDFLTKDSLFKIFEQKS